MTKEQIEAITLILETTLGNMSAQDADQIVKAVIILLKSFEPMDIDGEHIKVNPNRPSLHVDEDLLESAKRAAVVYQIPPLHQAA